MVKNLPANAGDTGLIPGPGRSHMPWSSSAHVSQLLRLRSGAREPRLLMPTCPRAVLHKRDATARRSPGPPMVSSPCPPRLDRSLHSSEDPAQPKPNTSIKNVRFKKKSLTTTVHQGSLLNVVLSGGRTAHSTPIASGSVGG